MWHSRDYPRGMPVRDPIVGEFFSSDAIDNPAQALIREGIQNSLDAAPPAAEVRIRLVLASSSWQLPGAGAAPWFRSAWPHFEAKGNGLRSAPKEGAACPYLVFEDFGTSGLTGDVAQEFDEPGTKNPFFYFFRAEGRSGKSESDRGRWGVGKHAFPRASAVSTVFGFTVRSDDRRRYLMGHAILKSHKLGTRHITPDLYFGESAGNELILPLADEKTLERFKADFRIYRTKEPGLSVVVPFIDPDFTHAALVAAVIRDYFLPILKGKLIVSIESPDGSATIDAKSLVSVLDQLDTHTQSELRQLVELSQWYLGMDRKNIVNLGPCKPDRPSWSDELVAEELISPMKSALENGAAVAVRAHLTVREKAPAERSRASWFDVVLREDEHASGKPLFIREGLVISDVRAPRTRGIRTLVIVEDKPLASLLGDSENPAHTQWQKDSANFKGKYTYGKSFIDFVTQTPSNIVHRLRAEEGIEDKTLLGDVFSLPTHAESLPKTGPRPKPKPGDTTDDPQDTIEPRKKRFRIQRTSGGFAIVRGDAGTDPPASLRVRVAYDVRRGNPLKKYDEADFRIGAGAVKLDPAPQGVHIVSSERNEILASITAPDFRLTVSGFDARRDLYVHVSLTEGSDAS